MYHNILIATDGSELAAKAISQGLGLAKSCKAKVTVLTVTTPFSSLGDKEHMFEGLPDEMRRQAVDYLFAESKSTLEEAGEAANVAGLTYELKSVEDAHPYDAIIRSADEEGCDLIVMASHGRSGASRLLLGSETTKVLTHTKIPVLVCR